MKQRARPKKDAFARALPLAMALAALLLLVPAIAHCETARAGESDLTVCPRDVDPAIVGVGVMTYPGWYDPVDFKNENTTLMFSDSDPNQGEKVTMNLTVFNVGVRSATALVLFYDGPNTGGALIGTDNVTVLPFNYDMAQTVWDTSRVTKEPHNIHVYVAPYDPGNESNDGNNYGNKPLSVNLRPNAVISGYRVGGVTNAAVWEGDMVNFDGTLSNDTQPDMSAGLTYTWNFDDPFSNGTNEGVVSGLNRSSVAHTFTASGNYSINLTVTDHGGAFGWTTLALEVENLLPTPRIHISPEGPYEDEVVTLSSNGSWDGPYDRQFLQSRWELGDGNSTEWSSGTSVTHAYRNAGDHTVVLWVRDPDGAVASQQASLAVLNAAPISAIGPVYVDGVKAEISSDAMTVDEDAVVLLMSDCSTDTASDRGSLTYTWSLGNGATLEKRTAACSFPKQGEYEVTLSVGDPHGACASDGLAIKVRNLPPVAEAGPDISLQQSEISFDAGNSQDTPSDLRNLSYSWDFGDGTTGEGAGPTHVYQSKGRFIVVLKTTDDDGAWSQDTLNVTINNISPIALIEGKSSVMEDEAFTLCASGSYDPDGTLASMVWEVAGEQRGSGEEVMLVFYSKGEYAVRLILTDNEGTRAVKPFKVFVSNLPPVAEAGWDNETFEGGSIYLNAAQSSDTPSDERNLTYLWDLGDNTTGEGPCLDHTYPSPGAYNVTLRVLDDDGAASIDWLTIWVRNNTLLSIKITEDLSPGRVARCKNFTVSGSIAYQFLKALPDIGANIALVTITIEGRPGAYRTYARPDGSYALTLQAPSAAGPYLVTVQVTRLGLAASSAKTLTVYVPVTSPTPMEVITSPVGIAAGTTILLLGAGVAFTAGTDIGRYRFFTLLIPLFTRLRKGHVLDNFERGRIFEHIRMNPGQHFSAIRDYLELNSGALTYHLHVLQEQEFIKSRTDGLYKRFYPAGMKVEKGQPSDIQDLILIKLAENPGMTQKQMAQALGINVSTVNYHINMMVGAGVVRSKKAGKAKTYVIQDLAIELPGD